MKKFLFIFLSFFFIANFSFAQSNEGQLASITSRVKIYLPSSEIANLEGTDRFIQIGIFGSGNDVEELVGFMDRFAVNDNDMIIRVGGGISEEMIEWYKFYLNPLYDANDFQTMLEMYKIDKFNIGKEEHSVKEFSNTVYASIKSKK